MNKMRKFFRRFRYGEKGFTLIELLVVVAILGVLAAVAVPNVGKFIDKGKGESYETELHNIQTATMAMLADSNAGELDQDYSTALHDMSTVKTDNGTITLDEYLTGLGDYPATTNTTETTSAKSGCLYKFDQDGTVHQDSTP
jgi:prepilin-type N-terminal cleavage/methylation domain-containing protein